MVLNLHYLTQSSVKMISFTVTGLLSAEDVQEFQAEDGMTWYEWIASPYNIYGNKIGVDMDNIVSYAFSTENSGQDINIYNDYACDDECIVYGDDVIISGHNYVSPPTSE